MALDAENNITATVDIDPNGIITEDHILIAPMQSFYVRRVNSNTVRRNNATTISPGGIEPGVAATVKLDPLNGGTAGASTPLDVVMSPVFRADCESVQHYKTNANYSSMLLAVYDVENHELNDASSLVFADHYTNEMDRGFDVIKNSDGGETAPTLFSVLEGNALVINKMKLPTENTQVPLGFYSKNENGKFKFGIVEIPGGWTVFLEDKMTGAWHDMQLGQYSFNNDVNFKTERFVLHFNMYGAPIESVYGPSTKAWRTEEGIEVSFTNIKAKQAEIVVTNLAGQLLYVDHKVSTEGNYVIPMDNVVQELFIVTVKSVELNESHKVVR